MPTRLGEFLASGVPCIASSVGDMGSLFSAFPESGELISSAPSDVELREGIARLLTKASEPENSRACRKVAEAKFDADSGASAYASIYREILI